MSTADGRLPAAARRELAERRLLWSYDGSRAPRRRRGPVLGRIDGGLLVGIGGRISAVRFRRR